MESLIYIYYDFGGTHSTALAAAYHLHLLPYSSSKLTKEQIAAVPFFNKLKKEDAGRFIFHGTDDNGHQVYTIGKRSSKLVIPALQNFCNLIQGRQGLSERIVFSNTSPTVPLAMTLGGFLARGLGLNTLGFPLLVIGSQQASLSIKKLVEKTKETSLGKQDEKVIHLTNEEFQT